MGQTIISAIGVYISTSIDYLIILIILIILFAQLSHNKQKWHIYAGQYLGHRFTCRGEFSCCLHRQFRA